MNAHCEDQTLLRIIRASDTEREEANAEVTRATQHLESCDTCRTRITELAADEDSWTEAAVALSDSITTHGSVVIAIDQGIPVDIPVQAESIPLDFLGNPKHPEMLGRIGRYDVERLIGSGGMGIVFKAFDTELHRPVAVKVLAPHLAHSGGARQRFAREAQSAAAVVHENVVPIHDVDATDRLPYLVMQYVAGESLQTRVERLGPLSVNEILRVGKQISAGLSAAHAEGLVHRDVKPGNILLEESIDRVLISDFGLARAADDASMTRSGVIAGTPHYMSPEQARGNAVDDRSDLFGLGSVLYFMCTGRPPFRAEGAMGVLNRICTDRHRPVDEVNALIPADLAELIDCLLQKDPARRPSNAAAVTHKLTSILQDKRSRTRFRRRSSSLNYLFAGAIALACLGACVAGGWALSNPNNMSQQAASPESSKQPNTQVAPIAGLASPSRKLQNPIESENLVAPIVGDDFDFYSEVEALKASVREFEAREFK